MEENVNYFDFLYEKIQKHLENEKKGLPSVSIIARKNPSPYRILASTIISLRTKDSVTLSSSRRLFEKADSFESLLQLDEKEIEDAIYPAAFYTRKAENLKEIAKIVVENYNGKLPDEMDDLMALPGVGIKSASLVLNLAFEKSAICVDCHVHQIVNRLGIVSTKSPEESEKELRKKVPEKYWISLNELFVSFGQTTCLPVSPYCSKCPIESTCPKIGVGKSR